MLFEIDPYPVASAAAAQAAFKAGRAVERRERELRVRGCLALKQGEDGAVALASDPRPPSLGGTGDVFVGTSTDPATIVRISVSKKASSATARLVRVASVQLKLGQAFVAGLHADGEFVYAATFTVPARVVKVSTMALYNATAALQPDASDSRFVPVEELELTRSLPRCRCAFVFAFCLCRIRVHFAFRLTHAIPESLSRCTQLH